MALSDEPREHSTGAPDGRAGHQMGLRISHGQYILERATTCCCGGLAASARNMNSRRRMCSDLWARAGRLAPVAMSWPAARSAQATSAGHTCCASRSHKWPLSGRLTRLAAGQADAPATCRWRRRRRPLEKHVDAVQECHRWFWRPPAGAKFERIQIWHLDHSGPNGERRRHLFMLHRMPAAPFAEAAEQTATSALSHSGPCSKCSMLMSRVVVNSKQRLAAGCRCCCCLARQLRAPQIQLVVGLQSGRGSERSIAQQARRDH